MLRVGFQQLQVDLDRDHVAERSLVVNR